MKQVCLEHCESLMTTSDVQNQHYQKNYVVKTQHTQVVTVKDIMILKPLGPQILNIGYIIESNFNL